MPLLDELPDWFILGFAVSFGLILGSFVNVVIHRLPAGESLAFPPSRCPACGAPIRPWHNIPLLSWLWLRGRARCCGAKISPRYVLVEACAGVLAWALVERLIFALPPSTPWYEALILFAAYLVFCLGLLAAVFIDLEHMWIPDEVTLGGTALGLVTLHWRAITWQQALLGAVVGFLIVWLPFDFLYRKVRGHPGMGLGDAKLLMLAGAWFGWLGPVVVLMLGAVQGTVVALAVLLAKGKLEEPEAVQQERAEVQRQLEQSEGAEREQLEVEVGRDPLAREPGAGFGQARIAFGPFLVLGTLEYLFFGDWVLQEYLWWVWGS